MDPCGLNPMLLEGSWHLGHRSGLQPDPALPEGIHILPKSHPLSWAGGRQLWGLLLLPNHFVYSTLELYAVMRKDDVLASFLNCKFRFIFKL